MSYIVEIGGLAVEVTRKNVKNLNLRIRLPDCRVCVSAPFGMREETVESVIAFRLDWVQRQRRRFSMRREPEREFVSGETHYFRGSPCHLKVIEGRGRPGAGLAGEQVLTLHVEPGADKERRRAVLEAWYRRYLEDVVPVLVRRWETIVGVQVAEWRIKRMKTRWGSCNTSAGRIWINLELATRRRECLEYVLVHEMVHLLERRHNARFYGYMDRFLPDWRSRRELLSGPSVPAAGQPPQKGFGKASGSAPKKHYGVRR